MNRIFRAFSLALSVAFLASFAVFSLAPHPAAAAGPCKVGIYGAPNEISWLTDIQSKLNSTGLFTQVDIHNVRTYTPTLAELQQYSAVLVFSDYAFYNSTELGNVLANYADAGGGVVVAIFAFYTNASISGRIASEGYLPFTTGPLTQGTPLTVIPDVPTHPLLEGVSSFDGGSKSYHSPISLTAGAFQVAHWSNGVPLVATKQPTTGKIVGLNFFPPSSDARSDLWAATTDGARLMGNALAWAGNCITADTSGVVGIYGADDPDYALDVQSKLNSTGLFTRVDIHKVNTYTPTLEELQQYSAVFVYSNFNFYNNIAMGDVLANYADAGGGVVVATFALGGIDTSVISGRITSEGYLPFTTGPNISGTLCTLIPDLPTHPILEGVSSFDGGSRSFHNNVNLATGATLVAHWSNNVPLVATTDPTTVKIVGLNFFPPSSDAQAGLWTASTDGALLMGNSLAWAACIDKDGDGYGDNCLAGPDCNDNNSAIHTPVTYYKDADGDGYGVVDTTTDVCSLTPPAGYADNSSGFDVDDTDPFYTNILPTCEVKIIPKILGWLIGDRERIRSLLVIGQRGTEFGETPVIKWESGSIDVVSTRVFFKRFMFMRATINGEPLEWEEYRVLVGDCEGSIRWAK